MSVSKGSARRLTFQNPTLRTDSWSVFGIDRLICFLKYIFDPYYRFMNIGSCIQILSSLYLPHSIEFWQVVFLTV